MNALFWQELVLIIFAVLIGMPIGCFLHRYFGAKSSVPSGRAAHTASTRRASAPAAVAAKSAVAKPAASSAVASGVDAKQAQAEDVAAETNRKMKEQQSKLDASSDQPVATEKPAVGNDVDKADKEASEASQKTIDANVDHVAADANAETALEEATQKDVSNEHVDDADQEIDLEAEDARITAALAALPKNASAEQKADAAGSKPTLLDAPRNGQADDLKRIKGVGKVIEGKLNSLGIHHFDQVADWKRDEVNWVTTYLSFKGRIDREEWIPQARGLVQAEASKEEIPPAKPAAKKVAPKKATASSKQKPATKTPAAKAPVAKKPVSKKVPETEKSGSETSGTETSGAETSGTKASAAKTAEVKAPETKAATSKKAAVDASQDQIIEADLNADGDIDKEEERIAAAIAALPKDASLEDKANVAGKKPRLLKNPRKAGADDLKRIKGVGKVIENKLNTLGVYHFDQVAKWNRQEINWVSTFLSFKGRVDRENWIEQATLLASGKETEFSKRVDKGEVESSKG